LHKPTITFQVFALVTVFSAGRTGYDLHLPTQNAALKEEMSVVIIIIGIFN
jgi:hypothetical protein